MTESEDYPPSKEQAKEDAVKQFIKINKDIRNKIGKIFQTVESIANKQKHGSEKQYDSDEETLLNARNIDLDRLVSHQMYL